MSAWSNTAHLLFLTFFSISLGQTTPGLMEFNTTIIDRYTKEITITFTVPKKDFIYKDFISCSVDDPTVLLSPWKSNTQPATHYDSSFKEAKQVFNENFTITMTSSTGKKQPLGPTYLYCSYYRRSEKKINYTQFPLSFATPDPTAYDSTDTTTEEPQNNNTIIRPRKKTTYFDHYLLSILCIAHSVITSLRTDHKKYFALIIFLILVLFSFSYFFKKELKSQIKIKELIEVIISLLIVVNASYLLLYLHALSSSLVTMIMACACAAYTGFFYIKKSTKLQSGKLRTFCTFIGMLCICSALLLSFKAVQYADDQFYLL